MKKEQFIKINEDGWNALIKSKKNFSNTSLPEYGPFMRNETELQIFKNVKGKKILELGCAAGESLGFLSKNGAQEVWGLDISEEQIKKAKELLPNANFYVSPMEVNPGIPEDYFDYVLSLYSIGFSSDPLESLKLASSYLKKYGKLIVCWTHPFFNCLDIIDDKLIIGKSYNDENPKTITKGPDKIEMAQYNLKISTLVNAIIKSGLELDEIIEEKPIEENNIGNYKSNFWDARKTNACPTTLILIAHKK